MFFPKRLLTPFVLCAALSPLVLAGCSQTTSHAMSVSALTDAITPSFFSARPQRASMRDRECLARAMFFESNRSSRDGMIAVGTVVMNRLKSGDHGNTICAVVGEPQQFAPGVLTRKMNSRALPDVMAAADAVLKGERSPKLKNTMYFHTAGLHFPYKNMHYTLVAGGNAFYEKRDRHFRELPPDSMFAFGGTTPDMSPEPQTMVASADPMQATVPASNLPGIQIPAKQADNRLSTVEMAQAQPSRSLFATSKPQRRQPVVAPPPPPLEAVAQADESMQPVSAGKKRRNQPASGAEQPLPANSPFMLASQDARPQAEEPVSGNKKLRRKSAANNAYQVAYAETPDNAASAILDPDNAPVPTARASLVTGSVSAEPQTIHKTKRLKAVAAKPSKAVVEMAADDQSEVPSAARFGRSDGGDDSQPVLSFNQ